MSHNVITFCGMPGTATDLEFLEVAAKKLSIDICIGYSRGCWNAMQYALQHPVAGVLLISPHWGSRTSPLLKLLLRIPMLSTFLLRMAGPRSIKKMLRETAFPKDVPASYQALESVYSQPEALRLAMLSPVHSIAEAQVLIQSLQVPVHAIAGSCDKALYMAEALRPWLKRLVTVHEAGHALPWTHGDVCVEVLGELIRLIHYEQS